PYAFAVFLVVSATYLFVLALDHPSILRWIAYGGLSALAIWAHAFSAGVIAAHILSLAFRRTRPRLRHLAAGYGTTALLVAPLVVLVLLPNRILRPFLGRPRPRTLETL